MLAYLPLTFSRRHGDPSRPWNKFSVRVRDASGRRVVNYEGNWRDIFQNWEALLAGEPAYAGSMIEALLGAMTPDGYNPYRDRPQRHRLGGRSSTTTPGATSATGATTR